MLIMYEGDSLATIAQPLPPTPAEVTAHQRSVQQQELVNLCLACHCS
jgi:hypothetical protein